MTEKNEKSSFIQMINSSMGNISGLFKLKKEEPKDEVEVGKIETDKEKDAKNSFLLNEEEEFEKDLSHLSIPFETPTKDDKENSSVEVFTIQPITSEDKTEAENEVLRLKRVLLLKEEIRKKEKEKEEEMLELKNLEMIKVQAQLEYERKQKKMLEQEVRDLRRKFEKSELECIELIKYCRLLIDTTSGKPE